MAERKASLIAVIGKPGTGKTMATIQMAKAINPQKLVVIDEGLQEPMWDKYKRINAAKPDDLKKLKGWGVSDYYSEKNYPPGVFNNMYDNLRNGVIVLDDCRTYIKNQLADDVRKIVARRRQHGNDIFLIVHGFTNLPPSLYSYISHYILFATTDTLDSRKEYISHYYDKLVEVQKRVNQKAQTNPYYKEIIDVGKLTG